MWIDFDWDGNRVKNVKAAPNNGATGVTHRDWALKFPSGKTKKCTSEDSAPQGGTFWWVGNTVGVGIHQSNPLIIQSPPIDAGLTATFPTPDTLQISMDTDLFPNYGYSVSKNGKPLFTHVTNETSCINALGGPGAINLLYGLNNQATPKTEFIATNASKPTDITDPCQSTSSGGFSGS
jgi:hypothetical protein